MNKLNLPNPKMMDVAVPANMRVGLAQEEIARRGWAVTRGRGAWRWSAAATSRSSTCASATEREKHGVIPGSLHAPYPDLQENIAPGGMLHELAAAHRQAARCSIAPSASARPWRCRRRRTRGSRPPATSTAASTPGRRRADRWRADFRSAAAARPELPIFAQRRKPQARSCGLRLRRGGGHHQAPNQTRRTKDRVAVFVPAAPLKPSSSRAAAIQGARCGPSCGAIAPSSAVG